VRRSPILALLLATLAAGAVAVLHVGAAGAAPAACKRAPLPANDKAVFGNFATRAEAVAYGKKAASFKFKGIYIDDRGCGDFQVEIGGADKTADRQSFVAEAHKAGFNVTFEQTGDPLGITPKATYGVLGTFRSVTKANALAWRLAAVYFLYIDIAYRNGKWLVVMPQVPLKSALSIAAEVHKAGFHIAFQSG
jgi:hypothetical protein